MRVTYISSAKKRRMNNKLDDTPAKELMIEKYESAQLCEGD